MTYRYQSIYYDRPIVKDRVIDVFMPENSTRKIALYFVHGGGWRGGSQAGYHAIIQAFCEKGFVCASTGYRLAGTTILDQIMDIRHGYDLFVSELKQLGMKDCRIVVHGSSAGAHLAALLTMALPGECGEPLGFRDFSLQNQWIRPAGAVLQSTPASFEPWEDMFPHIWTSMQDIVGTPYEQRPDLYKRVSPITYLSSATPPLYFMEAENEHMFPLRHIKAFIAKARDLGCRAEYKVYQDTEHGFFYDVTRRRQKEAFLDMLKFIESL
jgi:acetyl esterase/lipase